MRPINEIIVHCTATRADWWAGNRTSEKVAEIRSDVKDLLRGGWK